MATYQRWRGHAKDILYNYPERKAVIADMEEDILYGGGNFRDGQYRRGGISNPTQARALRLSEGRVTELQREVAAVSAIVKRLKASQRRDDADMLKLLDLLYFEATHTLYGAARVLHISEKTAKRRNSALLMELAKNMGWE